MGKHDQIDLTDYEYITDSIVYNLSLVLNSDSLCKMDRKQLYSWERHLERPSNDLFRRT